MKEFWEDVPGYEGMYQASTKGRARSIDRVVPHKRMGKQTVHGRMLIARPDQDGYLRVQLCRHGKIKVWGIHQLVALCFVNNPDGKPTVNHIDGDKLNNTPRNLEWATRREQEDHARDHGLKAIGERNWNTKLTVLDVINIKERLKKIVGRGNKKDSRPKIAKDYGVSNVTIHNIDKGKVWGHTG